MSKVTKHELNLTKKIIRKTQTKHCEFLTSTLLDSARLLLLGGAFQLMRTLDLNKFQWSNRNTH